MKSKNIFQSVGIAKLPRASFDLSHSVATAQKHGELWPLPPIECIPGDVFKLGISALVRANPLTTPPFMRAKIRTYSFFVPYRILFPDWEEFITKGEDGNSVVSLPIMDVAAADTDPTVVGSLWDAFGWPIGYGTGGRDAAAAPLQFPYLAYWRIWSEFFRIPGIQNEVEFTNPTGPGEMFQYFPAYRNWTRDYFTSALPWAQRGTAPSLPVFGTITGSTTGSAAFTGNMRDSIPFGNSDFGVTVDVDGVNSQLGILNNAVGAPSAGQITQATSNMRTFLDNNTLNATTSISSSLSSVDINDLRLTWQIQVWLERNARAGARYTEQLLSHFGRAPRDERLQRPEYIGGSVSDVMFSEVVQTSETATTPQGKLVGHGIARIGTPIGTYRVLEHGLIMTLACITPDAIYHQGIHASWLRKTTYDFYFPEFAGLGEQAIKRAEIFATGLTANDHVTFGYTGRYNELRYLPNSVHNLLRPGQNLQQWTGARDFATAPTLSAAFVSMATDSGNAGALMRPWVVTDPATTPPWLVQYAHLVQAHRPMPYLAEPSPILGG